MMQKEWVVARPAPAEHLQRYRGFGPVLAQVLHNRGFEDPSRAQDFISRSALDEDPFTMKGVQAAVARIEGAIADRQPIVVYGDFDADGVCATALMTQVLAVLGATVSPYIPDRAAEGYGLNAVALQRLAEGGARLVVTVDCGIRSVDEVAESQRAGLDIIVTDHHSVAQQLPPALAVINPRQDDCPGEAGLAGVGVAFMLAKALLLRRWATDRERYPKSLRLSDLLDLVALGTVADVMPLNRSLNRRFVRHGLNTINELRRPGIAALAHLAGLKGGRIRAGHIGFALGPRINAAGRIGSAMAAYDLLSATALEEAMPRATELETLNTRRRQLTAKAQAAISEQVTDGSATPLIFAGDDSIPAGIVGLVAGRLAEEFYRPAVVLELGEGQSRASCRSIPEFDITRALDECADLLVRHGGHSLAAGFTVQNRNIDILRRELQNKAHEALSGLELRRRLSIDQEIPLPALREELVKELDLLEPTGHENPPATFMSRGLNVIQCRRVGADGKHIKLKLANDGGFQCDAIGFGLGDWAQRRPRRIDAAYHVEMNEWNGGRELQMRVLDMRPADPASRSVTT